jgi:hypothetical protein
MGWTFESNRSIRSRIVAKRNGERDEKAKDSSEIRFGEKGYGRWSIGIELGEGIGGGFCTRIRFSILRHESGFVKIRSCLNERSVFGSHISLRRRRYRDDKSRL